MSVVLSPTELRRQEERFLKEALEYPKRRRSGRECSALMAYVAKDPDSIPRKYRQDIADILVKDGEGAIQRLVSDMMPNEAREAHKKVSQSLAQHSQTAVGSC